MGKGVSYAKSGSEGEEGGVRRSLTRMGECLKKQVKSSQVCICLALATQASGVRTASLW